MALRPDIILAVQPVDAVGAMSRGNELAAQTNALRDQNALRDVYRTQGANLLQGDQNALNQLAMVNAPAALELQGAVMENRTAQRKFEILNAQERRAIAEASAKADEAQRAQMLEATRREVFRFLAAPDAATFDRLVTEAGKPELVGQFASRNVLAADFVSSVEEAIKLGQGGAIDPTDGAPTGTMWRDPNNRAAGVLPLPGYERSPGVVVNTGDTGPQMGAIPSGFAAVPAPESPAGVRLVPVPGGPADNSARAERTQNQGRLKLGTTLESLNLNIADVEDGGLPVTGRFGDFRRTIIGRMLTGDSAVDFGNRTAQITDSAAFAEIQNMRDNSPTGGAVGQLTDAERTAIGNAVTALNNSTSAEEYARAARAYRDLALNIAYGEGQWELGSDGQPRVVTPRAPAGQPETNIDPGAVEILRQNNTPEYRQFFDEVFGEGAAARVLGGN